ncbi:MAG: tetratricopeptide repeat protein, partial [Gammaproteobacteria bacterium]
MLGSIISFSAVAQDTSQSVQDSEYVRGVRAFADGDFEQAAEFWLADAYRGAADAQFNLGVLYIEGKGLPVDRGEAIFWFEKAANQGHPEAQYNLGHLLLEQTGDVEKISQGIEWWRKSAEAGFAVAQYNYGRALYYGVGVNESRPKAKSWFEKSAAGGNIKAERFLAQNANNFSDDPVPASLTEPTAVGASGAAGVSEPLPNIAEVEASEYVLVKDQPILMYSRFNTFSPIITRVGAKILLRVVASKRNWILAEVPGGVPGWLQNDQIKSVESDKAEVVVDSATVYADPTENTEANDIGKLLRGSKSLLLEQQPGWSRIQLPEKIPGWIEADQVDIVETSPEEIAKVWQSQRIKQRITAPASREIKIAGAGQQWPTPAMEAKVAAVPKSSDPESSNNSGPIEVPKQER